MSVQAGRHEAVEARSVELRKELSVLDLAFAQILFIVGLQWVGVAARQGPSHVVFWLVAILLFYVPSAIVAVWLNRAMPLEGGLYQWVKLGFNDAVGFIVGWNLWLFAILNMTNVGLQFTQYLGYIFGARVEAFVGQAWVTAAMSAIVTGALVWITLAGLRIGKWVHTAGGILMLAMFATIIALPWLNVASGSLAEYHPLQTATPVISLLSLNLLGKMGFGAFAGFEYVAIHAGECRNPVRSITTSDAHRRADHHRDVRLRHQLGRGDDPVRRHRPHRADPAAPLRRLRPARRDGRHRPRDPPADHPGREPHGVRDEDRGVDCRDERDRCGVVLFWQEAPGQPAGLKSRPPRTRRPGLKTRRNRASGGR